jgi:hypothetical protein
MGTPVGYEWRVSQEHHELGRWDAPEILKAERGGRGSEPPTATALTHTWQPG